MVLYSTVTFGHSGVVAAAAAVVAVIVTFSTKWLVLLKVVSCNYKFSQLIVKCMPIICRLASELAGP
jgi:hypothetical protein